MSEYEEPYLYCVGWWWWRGKELYQDPHAGVVAGVVEKTVCTYQDLHDGGIIVGIVIVNVGVVGGPDIAGPLCCWC